MTGLSRKIIIICAALLLLACQAERAAFPSYDPVDQVSTLTGTLSKHSLSTGNTYPAVAMPWGMNFWTPQTGKMGDGWTYTYTADRIRGFKQTHQPSPWINDYGQFSIMPSSKAVFDEDERASWFSHKAETATPYHYAVYLADHDTYVELTPTERAAMFRIKYPEADMSYLIVDAYDRGSYVRICEDRNMIVGYSTRNSGGVSENFRNWFVIVSDTPFDSSVVVADGVSADGNEAESLHSGAVVGFRTGENRQVELKVASSFISLEQAMINLGELGDRSFDEIKTAGRDRWNDLLGRFVVEDDDIDNIRTFYSCLYRSLLFPRDISEIDAEGRRVHYSPHTGKVHPGHLFTDTGVWDTFRSLFPLMNLVYPEVSAKVQEGYVNHYLESGFLPEWSSPGHRACMVGNNTASVVADAWLSGVRGYDIETLWTAVTAGANSVHPSVDASGRVGYEHYNEIGYVPCDIGINESAARTLEYAYDDWCIWQLGKALGKSDDELSQYKENALNYRNLYDTEYGMMNGRRSDGEFRRPFNPLKWGGDFTEGNALQYTWSVFHDVEGLMELMGGREGFASALDGVFDMPPYFDESYYGFVIHEIREMQIMNMGNYAHGNQPIQHMLYLYDWCGQPWKTQEKVREVMDRFYSYAPDGYCGDEDNGQTSAWYVFSAMGFYPVCPGSGEYALGSPLFRKVTVNPSLGKSFVITAEDNSDKNRYVSSMSVDGRKYDRNFITLDHLRNGARMKFVMSDHPDFSRGVSDEAIPYSFSE
ncbi:MAG: GH92 family glycosyl hydrolase [Bacteroidales bacterium]|nr:GH92 family glycosyl hydrolase [Bacteroidales bacterium]